MIQITNEDNMLLMARYPDKYFDLAIVDPPYGIGMDKAINANKGKQGYKQYKQSDWDNATPNDEYFIELFRVSKKQIIWGGNYFSFIWKYSNSFILWNKKQREFTLADGELAWYSETNKALRIFDFSRGECIKSNNTAIEKFHPTAKPFELYKWLLHKYAKQGDKILDTHLGSGSIAIACHDYGFDLTACELDKEYYDKAMERLNNHMAQQKLF